MDHTNPQHNLFHPNFIFTNAIYGMTVLKKNVVLDFKQPQAHIHCGISDIPG